MKREFLKDLDLGEGARLPDAAIEAIMAEHGKTTGTLQESISSLTKERDGLQAQLTTAQSEAAKYADYDTLKAQRDALQKDIDTRNARDKVAAATGVPASLLTGQTEEECQAQAKGLLDWRGVQPGYPTVRDAGEQPAASGGKTRDQFADWFQGET